MTHYKHKDSGTIYHIVNWNVGSGIAHVNMIPFGMPDDYVSPLLIEADKLSKKIKYGTLKPIRLK